VTHAGGPSSLASALLSFKTEMIANRVWRSRPQLELATVAHIGWFNHERLHESLGYVPPAEHKLRIVWGAKTPFTPRDHPNCGRNRVLTPHTDDAEKLRG
jgi:Integrase core domain